MRKKITRCIICIYFLPAILFSDIAVAQIPNLYFKHLTPNDGLTQGVINFIYTDTKGFVWMTGMDGINRFDGSHCIANGDIAPGLNNPGITRNIIEDKNGDIWIGYNDGLIQYSYQSNQFTLHKLAVFSGELNKNGHVGIYQPIGSDMENNIIISGQNQMAIMYNTITGLLNYIKEPVEHVHLGSIHVPASIPSLQKGWKWILNTNDSILIYTLSGITADKPIWKTEGFSWQGKLEGEIWMPDENNLFFYSNKRIYKYYFASGAIKMSPEIQSYTSNLTFSPDTKGNVLISNTGNGIQLLDTASMQISLQINYNIGNSNGISSHQVGAFIDRNQMLWVKSWGKGVDYADLKEARFTSYLSTDEAKTFGFSNFIRGIAEAPDGDFFCSTQSGIIVLDKNLHFKKILPGCRRDIQYPDLAQVGNNLYYVSDANQTPGFSRYDLQTGITKMFKDQSRFQHLNPHFYRINNINFNEMLLASNEGIWKFIIGTESIETIPGININPDSLYQLVGSYQDKKEQVYLCSNNHGFSVYNNVEGIYKVVFTMNEKITVKHFIPKNDSLLWIGTSGGLYLFNIMQLKIINHFTTDEGLPNNVVYAIEQDDYNNLWLSTNKGLSYFNISKNTFTNFTMEDGLQANEFNTHAVIKTTDGRIIFGGVNGLTVVNPGILTAKTQSPVLQITELKSDSTFNPYPYNEKDAAFIIHAGTNTIEVELTAINFSNPRLCKIKYRLLGFEDNWQFTTNPGRIRFTRLPPGRYILEAISSDIRGEFGTEVKKLEIIVEAFWWQTTWARISAFAIIISLLALSILAYMRYKLKRQEEKLEKQVAIQSERERIISDLHDDVGATLSSMHIYSDLAKSVWDKQPGQSKDMVSRISVQSRELMNRMNDIVWSLKTPGEEKNSLLLKLKNYSQDLLSGKSIGVHFDIDETLDLKMTDPLVRKNVLLIAKEAINNIAKYSEATDTFITFIQKEDQVLFSIRDNGKGFNAGKPANGNGLGNMAQRCKQLNGTCIIESAPGKGVTINCLFPLARISHII